MAKQKAKTKVVPLAKRLEQIAGEQQRHDGTETYVYDRKRNAYLSGYPYLWSCFGERAFIFRDGEQAAALIRQYPDELAGCEVRAFKPRA